MRLSRVPLSTLLESWRSIASSKPKRSVAISFRRRPGALQRLSAWLDQRFGRPLFFINPTQLDVTVDDLAAAPEANGVTSRLTRSRSRRDHRSPHRGWYAPQASSYGGLGAGLRQAPQLERRIRWAARSSSGEVRDFPRAMLCLLAAGACASADRSVDPSAYTRAIADQPGFRSRLEKSCPDLNELDETIGAAISIGAPIYNAGSPLGCYRIYEGAAYKLLYRLEQRCPGVTALLRSGLARAESQPDYSAKAWTMRRTFDAILGETTSTGSLLR